MQISKTQMITGPARRYPPGLTWGAARGGRLSALVLDRLADAELQHGHVAQAERLAQLAANMREAV